jgi:hypothetical protein
MFAFAVVIVVGVTHPTGMHDRLKGPTVGGGAVVVQGHVHFCTLSVTLRTNAQPARLETQFAS